MEIKKPERNIVRKKVGDQWLPTAIQFLREGDIFKVYYPNLEPITHEGMDLFEVVKDPEYIEAISDWNISMKPIEG
jgi:hypothetical protein